MKTIDKISIKEELDSLCIKYETKDFIKDDPVQFIHLFKNPKDIEIAGRLKGYCREKEGGVIWIVVKKWKHI